MEMTINKLPAPTWNRLGMNESRISNITIDAAWKAQIQVSNAAITRENTEIDWNSLNSGLGQDMDILGESIEADSFHVEKNAHENDSFLLSLIILCFSACKCPASWFPWGKRRTMYGACRAP